MTAFADYHDRPVLLVGHVKGGDTKEKIYRNFGDARPEG
jgi:acetyl-CoA carboxylase carboxyl transferase subunit alpha